MSTAQLSTAELRELPGGISHLLVADEALIVGRWGSYIAVCGAEVRPAGVTAAETADDPERADDPEYCLECVRAAVRWSTRSTAR